MNIIAFDPGKEGGIAYSANGFTSAQSMPTTGKDLDLPTIAGIIKTYQFDLAIIERVASRPGQGVASMFTFGMGYGQIQGLLAGIGVPFELVLPQAWKKVVLAGTTKDKTAAIAYCNQAFPGISLIPPRCRTPHDGMADALCLMQYGLRTFGKTNQRKGLTN